MQKLKILIFMSPFAQGYLPSKSATNLLYFSSTLCGAASAIPAAEKLNYAVKATSVWKLMPEMGFFFYNFFNSLAEFKMNTCAEYLNRAQLGDL